MIVWQYIYRIFNDKYWQGQLRDIPVFLKELKHDKLGEFQFTESGIDSILLATNQNLEIRETMGVLLHEMCHVSALKNHGFYIEAHGDEWKAEMRSVGFVGEISELTDGIEFFTDEDCQNILKEYNARVLNVESR
tara:strand:- start:426 stop:830 length:405 start_codon:yes stop_codon:yes gene_type:complete